MFYRYVFTAAVLLLFACSSDQGAAPASATTRAAVSASAQTASTKRWYGFSQVSQGARVFAEHCAECHGKGGEGHPAWRQVGPDGRYPAPPLNGSGHAWHHPLKMLFYVVKHGSPGGQGNMPAWQDKLSDDAIVAAIAWFQSRWPETIYQAWVEREQPSGGG